MKLIKDQIGMAVLFELSLTMLVLGTVGFSTYNIKAGETIECSEQSCFEAAFAECKKSTFDYTEAGARTHLEIYGRSDDDCRMLVKFIDGQLGGFDYSNTEMTCNFDNDSKLEDSVGKTIEKVFIGEKTSCQGSLIERVKAEAQKNQKQPS
jgi:SHS2 domain-containing protein